MNKIVQIRLPTKEVDLIDKLVKKGWYMSRSDFLQKSVTHFIPIALDTIAPKAIPQKEAS